MNENDIDEFLFWLWDRLDQEPDIQRAIEMLPFINERRLKMEIKNKLLNMN